MTSTQGIPTHYVLAPAAHHDVTVAPELLESYQPYFPKSILSLGDKGYVGLQKRLQNSNDFRLIIQQRTNQTPNNEHEKAFLGIFRKTIETVNSLAGQFNIQFTRAKSAFGLTNRIIAKITALTLCIFINYLAKLPHCATNFNLKQSVNLLETHFCLYSLFIPMPEDLPIHAQK
jgi:Transposase DDE domain